ncbi:hypothetical protein A9X02_06200 [Mycobacterium malmoense]|nr:hypothetical protein A9X02_06200 [Mycobacterium malmoense]
MIDLGLRKNAAEGLRMGAAVTHEAERADLSYPPITHLLGPQIQQRGRVGHATGALGSTSLNLDKLVTFQACKDTVCLSN